MTDKIAEREKTRNKEQNYCSRYIKTVKTRRDGICSGWQ